MGVYVRLSWYHTPTQGKWWHQSCQYTSVISSLWGEHITIFCSSKRASRHSVWVHMMPISHRIPPSNSRSPILSHWSEPISWIRSSNDSFSWVFYKNQPSRNCQANVPTKNFAQPHMVYCPKLMIKDPWRHCTRSESYYLRMSEINDILSIQDELQ